jgi:hypothetical protein
VYPGASEEPGTSDQYCVIVPGKATETESSPEEFRYCQETPFDTQAYLDARPGIAAAKQTHIARMYKDTDYRGTWWDYYGADGPCDKYGYKWNPSDWWQHNLSSVKQGYNSNCNWIQVWSLDRKSWDFYQLPAPNIGKYGDNISEMQIFNR